MDSRNNKREIYINAGEFVDEVGYLFADALRELGLDADDFGGVIRRGRLNELLDFCQENPELHIISVMKDGTIINRASTTAQYFLVGDGNANPRLAAKDILLMRNSLQFKYELLAKFK